MTTDDVHWAHASYHYAAPYSFYVARCFVFKIKKRRLSSGKNMSSEFKKFSMVRYCRECRDRQAMLSMEPQKISEKYYLSFPCVCQHSDVCGTNIADKKNTILLYHEERGGHAQQCPEEQNDSVKAFAKQISFPQMRRNLFNIKKCAGAATCVQTHFYPLYYTQQVSIVCDVLVKSCLHIFLRLMPYMKTLHFGFKP